MDIYRIDLRNVRTRAELHSAISSVLPLPDYYGNNLDALFDVLTEWGNETTIEFVTDENTEEELGGYYDAFTAMLKAADAGNPDLTVIFSDAGAEGTSQEGNACPDTSTAPFTFTNHKAGVCSEETEVSGTDSDSDEHGEYTDEFDSGWQD